MCLSGVARKTVSLQKNFRGDENLFFRSVTGLAIVDWLGDIAVESAEGAPLAHFLASLQRRLRWDVRRHLYKIYESYFTIFFITESHLF